MIHRVEFRTPVLIHPASRIGRVRLAASGPFARRTRQTSVRGCLFVNKRFNFEFRDGCREGCGVHHIKARAPMDLTCRIRDALSWIAHGTTTLAVYCHPLAEG